MPVSKTEAFRTSDDALFTSEAEAKKHQLGLELKQWYAANYLSADYSRVDFDDMVNWIQSNSTQVRQILSLE